MFSFNRVFALFATIALAAAMSFATLVQSHAQNAASIRLHIVKAGFIVGFGGGSGTLDFMGRQYQLNVGGINVGTIGLSGVDLMGTASNLRTAEDIVGTYTQGSAALAIVGGARVATLQNPNGVVIQVSGPEVGLEASLSLSGMTISLQQ